MNILGAYIKEDEIIGISALAAYQTHNPEQLYYYFSVITRSSSVQFQSDVITDFRIATKTEQAQLQAFKKEYEHVRTCIISMLGENEEEFRYHADKVSESFNTIVEIHKLLEDELRVSKAKSKLEWLHLLSQMRPPIIHLKNLAE